MLFGPSDRCNPIRRESPQPMATQPFQISKKMAGHLPGHDVALTVTAQMDDR
jgi:hypothetical protein